ncbi:TIGR04197 family type VII secretion effector [Ligilactobacillus sp. LYQ135]
MSGEIKVNKETLHNIANSIRTALNDLDSSGIVKDESTTIKGNSNAKDAIDKVPKIINDVKDALESYSKNLDGYADAMEETDNNTYK